MLPRRSIDELAALYSLEKSVKDIFVEGVSDAAVVREATSDLGANVYAIESVEVPFELLSRLQLPDNNRGRVIALAQALAEQFSVEVASQVVCVVDADFDYLKPEVPNHGPLLVRTDHANLPMYGFDTITFGRLLEKGMGIRLNPADVLAVVDRVVCEAFLVRAAANALGLDIAPIPLQKACTREHGTVTFDVREYLKRTLLKTGDFAREAAVVDMMEALRPLARQRRHANSHDVAEFLAWYLRAAANRSVTAEVMEMLWRIALDVDRVNETALFAEIRRRLGR
jgi:hypothetical protein